MEWWHSRARSGQWLRLEPQTLCLRQKRAPDLIWSVWTHPEQAQVFYSPITPKAVPHQDWGFWVPLRGQAFVSSLQFLVASYWRDCKVLHLWPFETAVPGDGRHQPSFLSVRRYNRVEKKRKKERKKSHEIYIKIYNLICFPTNDTHVQEREWGSGALIKERETGDD